MPKKMSDTTPMKGLPSRHITGGGGFRNPRQSLNSRSSGKKEGGVKLLDITEQPMGYAAAKKRKRQQEMDDAKKAAEEAAANAAAVKTEMANNNTTPDYAAGLSSNLNATSVAAPPAYAPPTPLAPAAPPPAYAPAPPTATAPVATPVAALPGGPGVNVPLPQQPLPPPAVTRLVQLPTHPLPQARMPMVGQPRANLPPANVLGGLQASVLQQRVQPGQVRQTYVQAPGQQQVIRQVKRFLFFFIISNFFFRALCKRSPLPSRLRRASEGIFL